jgi:hypothetical protein
MSNFHFDLSLKLSQGEVHDFSGEVQKFSGEVQNDLRGRPTPPHTSLQNPAMLFLVRSNECIKIPLETFIYLSPLCPYLFCGCF